MDADRTHDGAKMKLLRHVEWQYAKLRREPPPSDCGWLAKGKRQKPERMSSSVLSASAHDVVLRIKRFHHRRSASSSLVTTRALGILVPVADPDLGDGGPRLFPAPPPRSQCRGCPDAGSGRSTDVARMRSDCSERGEPDRRPSSDAEARTPWRGLRRSYQMLTNLSDQGCWTF
jgi:hypothetical protein